MVLRRLFGESREAIASGLAVLGIRSATNAPRRHALDICQLEDRVMFSAAPMPVEAIDMAGLEDGRAGRANEFRAPSCTCATGLSAS